MTLAGTSLRLERFASIDALEAAQWNSLEGTDCPFLRHEFLAALEHSGCTAASTGWHAAHLGIFNGNELLAAAPAWSKVHSWGEFVFDFGWAQAYARHGLDYYPKLVCASPFSPVTGPKLLLRRGHGQSALRAQMIGALADQAGAREMSSAHALFIDVAECADFEAQGWLLRRDVQFHWRNAGYRDFEDYLQGFTAEKRKKVRRERRRCLDAGITFETLTGAQLSSTLLENVYQLTAQTFLRHGHEPYLNLAFFRELVAVMPAALVVVLARRASEVIATAVFLRSDRVLFGRYWGAAGDFHSLHFETCYHQGIEYCIANGLERFEPGTQGEHKVARGFRPALTSSAHWIADPRFREAIAESLQREAPAVAAYAAEVEAHVPYRRP